MAVAKREVARTPGLLTSPYYRLFDSLCEPLRFFVNLCDIAITQRFTKEATELHEEMPKVP